MRFGWVEKQSTESLGRNEFLEDNICWDGNRTWNQGNEYGPPMLCDLGELTKCSEPQFPHLEGQLQ
jgi:hypothetical protein